MNFMMMQILAEAATDPDTMISGKWLLAIIPAVIAALGAVWIKAKSAGIKEATNNVTIQSPVPKFDVNTREEIIFASRDELEDHIMRTDKSFTEIWAAIDGERKIARDALGKIHNRIDNQATSLATLAGASKSVESTVNKLLDLALGKKPPGTR